MINWALSKGYLANKMKFDIHVYINKTHFAVKFEISNLNRSLAKKKLPNH